jgi:PAS domain S-box-containing protein
MMPGPARTTPAEKVNILLVDDQPARLLSYEVILGDLNQNLVAVGSGAEALQRLMQDEFAVILLDVNMPGMDGFETAAMIHQHPRFEKTPIIFVTAFHITDLDRMKGYELGAVDYVYVPVIPQILRSKVAVLVELYTQRRELERLNRTLERANVELADANVTLQADKTRELEKLNAVLERANADLAQANGSLLVEIAERKRAEQARRRSEERLRSIVETAQDAIITIDEDGLVESVNNAADRLFGYEHGELIGKSAIDLMSPSSHDQARSFLSGELSAASGPAIGIGREVVGYRKDGKTFPMHVSVSELVVGGRRMFTWIARDITELTSALEREHEFRRQAEHANRLKDDFLATLSHELRTPLNAVLGWTQVMRIGTLSKAEHEHGLEAIERNARMQAQLIGDLLDMSRILSGKLRLELQPVDVRQLMTIALEAVRPSARAKELDLVEVLENELPTIEGDPGRLQQVFWNLLSNAIKFTPKGGRVEVHVRNGQADLEVVVVDTGVGISPDFLPHVFERFRQADSSTKRNQGGLGLGLAIVSHLVEIHGGTVGVHSAGAGQGASFTVRLPVATRSHKEPAADPEKHQDAASEDAQASAKNDRLDDVRVLLVDDDADARDVMQRLLGLYGARVSTAASAREALEAIGTFLPDVLISDIGMPGEDGYDLIGKVRSLPPERGGRLPALALTAFARPEDGARAIEAGYQVHMAKPVRPAELLRAVKNVIANCPPCQLT